LTWVERGNTFREIETRGGFHAMALSILHVAVENTCGIPLELVRAHRRHGHRANLITYVRSKRGYGDDLCLDYPFAGTPLLEKVKKTLKVGTWVRQVEYGSLEPEKPPVRVPKSLLEKGFLAARDLLWERRLARAVREWNLLDYDIYHLEGGVGFLSSGGFVKELKARGKKIVTMYYGSDLRLRGLFPEVDAASDLDLTIEYDHLRLAPKLTFVFLPLDVSRFAVTDPGREEKPVRIGHSPTRRELKGTDAVIRAIEEVKRRHEVELVLIEGMPYEEAVRRKSTCHIFIDQVGNKGGTGYGTSSVEALAMGIPTLTDIAPDMVEFLPGHPFVLATPQTLAEKIVPLVVSPEARREKGREARAWVMRTHHSDTVAERIYALYAMKGWIGG
jgi:glycosyltransferase involved in cell wall biosynthesis